VVRTISLFGLLFGVWLLLSGFFSPFFLGLAVICCALVVIIARRMDRVDGDPLSFSIKGRAIGYIPWLAWQIVRANIDVMRLVLQRDMAIDPQLEWVPAGQKSDLGTTIYANSITLTPGTVSTSVESGRILVHALTAEGIAELRAGAMDAAVRELES
jgi:multicomponent Na+:H+ antiporter subunit E